MSAIDRTVGEREREPDTLRRAQRAHEASMEEILASIRTIITEERAPAKAMAAKEPPRVVPPAVALQAAPAHAAAEPISPPPRFAPVSETIAPKVVWSQPVPAPEDEPAAAFETQAEPDLKAPPETLAAAASQGPLLARETEKAVGSAFEALSANLATRSAERAEAMAREMLRPMLKTWLDENLPGIVERLIGAEIERIVRESR
jgi:cell pole-organizing protein PopZ